MFTWKLRITVLWIFLAICQTAGMAMIMFQPGAVRDMMAGELLGADLHSAGVQINTALFWLGPMAMAYLTLVLKDVANRRTNAFLGAGALLNTSVSTLSGDLAWESAGATFVNLVGAAVAALIVWHAWKWPAPDNSPAQAATARP